ncbi:MAG TPA: cyclic nucleotide-binding domain-containing protein [Polyangiaceae bacterium]|jgi:Fe-S-cluster-containing dehydrogenase component/CRP-like cAMP-binding protein|nr:cyclic nucleotide-binding domain-containing protein [Polyangiaceae bacterium]
MSTWPSAVFDAPLLRGLDERGKGELVQAGRLIQLAGGDVLFRRGDRGQALFIVAGGKVALEGVRRGDDLESELREVAMGDSCGEEACIGATFRATASAREASLVAELPVALVRRALVRAGGQEVAERFERRARRRATAELFATLAFTAQLDERDREMLLDAAIFRELGRGEIVYRVGEVATHLWLVADGMVQLQTEDEERLRVRAYLVRGDFFGDEELLGARVRRTTAVASGASLLVGIPAQVARTIADRNPQLLRKLRRVAETQQDAQLEVVHEAVQGATQHAFRDLYRLQVARSLLVIDLDSCVRCGHCAWSCEALHGVARLVRRGDKIVTRVGEAKSLSPLLLPNSCQHCENPACMPDCPTGAIGRDPRGEVFIRDELCTGCGACAKGCPWDNIQIVPRPPDAPRPPQGRFDELAVKCDLCRDYEGPACVRACPTESIFRLNPAEELPEVAAALRVETGESEARPTTSKALLFGAAACGVALAIAALEIHTRAAWVAWRGAGYAMGIVAALTMLLLIAYTLPKRLVRRWSKKKKRDHQDRRVKSLVRPQLGLHIGIGLVAPAFALAHGGAHFGATTGGALAIAFQAASVFGLLLAFAYALIPRRLARIERSAVLPEDFGSLRRELSDRLFAGVTGKSDLVKRIFEKVLVPYLRRTGGWFALIARGRTLADEQSALRARIDRMLQGRGAERLAGLEDLVRLVVELRALRAQRVLTFLLRVWLPLHITAVAVAFALLIVHVIEALA